MIKGDPADGFSGSRLCRPLPSRWRLKVLQGRRSPGPDARHPGHLGTREILPYHRDHPGRPAQFPFPVRDAGLDEDALQGTTSTGWTSNNFVTYLLLSQRRDRKAQMEEKLVEIDKVYSKGRPDSHAPGSGPSSRSRGSTSAPTWSRETSPTGAAPTSASSPWSPFLVLRDRRHQLRQPGHGPARPAGRREVGIRKVVGSTEKSARRAVPGRVDPARASLVPGPRRSALIQAAAARPTAT
ncbi:MAG: hypothetical protein M0C28_03880 [Candidatus Moduliflexus flocculans]|nr:hypothetical protein [Candidatus Moduliflexus flocculans]